VTALLGVFHWRCSETAPRCTGSPHRLAQWKSHRSNGGKVSLSRQIGGGGGGSGGATGGDGGSGGSGGSGGASWPCLGNQIDFLK